MGNMKDVGVALVATLFKLKFKEGGHKGHPYIFQETDKSRPDVK